MSAVRLLIVACLIWTAITALQSLGHWREIRRVHAELGTEPPRGVRRPVILACILPPLVLACLVAHLVWGAP